MPTSNRTRLLLMAAVLLSAMQTAMAVEPSVAWNLLHVEHPRENPPSEEKIALGKQLFFDARLSRTGKISCASCHDPAQGWSDGRTTSVGVDGRRTTRHAPTLINVVYYKALFWDGRATTLEEQALLPIASKSEMDMPLDRLVAKLNGIDAYREKFQNVFGSDATAENIAQAVAAFERTIVSRDAPIDRYMQGDESALSPPAERGMQLFFGEARCHVCHAGPEFTDHEFHNVGVGIGPELFDAGREEVSRDANDRGRFKTPTLREVARTAPYMHDGSFETLEKVVQHYNFGGVTDAANDHRDEELQVLYLSDQQVADLVVFLKEGLAGRDYPLRGKELGTEH